MRPLLQIELNEVNFDFVRAYGAKGKLPVLNELIAEHGLIETRSEHEYEHLEPWIQWITAHTGKTYAEHQIFRLGDIVQRRSIEQIWETLEKMGIRVGAISPMNAANRCDDAAFFMPDPWTNTAVTGDAILKRLYEAVSKAVNANATGGGLGKAEAAALIEALVRFAQPKNYPDYARLAAQSVTKSYSRAILLDRLLADIFISQTKAKAPDYATLFLNAAAHIQHHYLFNSAVYDGPLRNPEWYAKAGDDPVLSIYSLYDRIIAQIRGAFPEARLLIATGLHQDPYPRELYYWRLVDHSRFMNLVGVSPLRVEPRMSRDFVLYFADDDAAAQAQAQLAEVRADDGVPLFEIDNRGDSLFVELTYPSEIKPDARWVVGDRKSGALRDEVALVALKNGEHNGIGYLIDTDATNNGRTETVALSEIFHMSMAHFAAR